MTKLKTAKLIYENGETTETSVNGKLSNVEIARYFLGQSFNLASFPKERFVKCVRVIVI